MCPPVLYTPRCVFWGIEEKGVAFGGAKATKMGLISTAFPFRVLGKAGGLTGMRGYVIFEKKWLDILCFAKPGTLRGRL